MKEKQVSFSYTSIREKAATRLRQIGIPWGPAFAQAHTALMAGKLVIVRDGIVSIRN